MALIHPPVSKCTITLKYLYWTPDRINKRYYHDSFNTIAELKQYFIRNPGAGALVGYGKVPAGNAFAFEGVLILQWTDAISTVSKEFLNVFAFTAFLKENPELARCVGYEWK
jgi:hypothetical protein